MKKTFYRVMKSVVAATLLSACGHALADDLTDDNDTLGLWHMDSLDGIVEDDNATSRPARDLTANGGVTLVSPGYDESGGALRFDGSFEANIGASNVWPIGDTEGFVLDMRFKLDEVTGGKLAYTQGFSIDLGDSHNDSTRVRMTVYGESSEWSVSSNWDEIKKDTWHRLQAGFEQDDSDSGFKVTLMLDGNDIIHETTGSPIAMKTATNGWFTMGRSVDGLIDEVKLSEFSSIPEPTILGMLITIGILFVARRRRR